MVHIRGIPRNSRVRRKPIPVRIFDINDEFPFGRHRNRSVAYVLDNNPSYLVWLVNSSSGGFKIRFTQPVMDRLEVERLKPDYKDVTPFDFYREINQPTGTWRR